MKLNDSDIISELKDNLDKEQLMDVLMVKNIVMQDFSKKPELNSEEVEDVIIKELHIIGYNVITNLDDELMDRFLKNETTSDDIFYTLYNKLYKNETLQVSHIYNKKNHDYSIILILRANKKKWYKRLFTKFKLENLVLNVLVKGNDKILNNIIYGDNE